MIAIEVGEIGAVREIGEIGKSGKSGEADELAAAIAALYGRHSTLSILIMPAQQEALTAASAAIAADALDEIWVMPQGVRGFLALIRRISWRRFEAVYQPCITGATGAAGGTQARLRLVGLVLFYLTRPRPTWYRGALHGSE